MILTRGHVAYTVLVALCVSGTAQGTSPCTEELCDKTFILAGGSWFDPNAWMEGEAPGPTDVACVGSGKVVMVFTFDGEAQAVCVESGGRVEIEQSYTLTLHADDAEGHEDSIIDGEMCIYEGGELHIENSLTLSGTGGFEPETLQSGNFGRVTGAQGAVLTIGTQLTLRGSAQIEVELVNNGKVIAELGGESVEGALRLINQPKRGSGTWEALGPEGELYVGVEVTGSGTWKLADDAGAKIVFDAVSECLTGSFEVSKGTVEVRKNVVTSGELSLGGSGKIEVIGGSAGASAEFSVPLDPIICTP